MTKLTKVGNLLAVGTFLVCGSVQAQVDNTPGTDDTFTDNTVTETTDTNMAGNTATGPMNDTTDYGTGTGNRVDNRTDIYRDPGMTTTTTTDTQPNWGWLGLLGLAGLAGLLRKPERNETVHTTNTTPPPPR